MTLTEFEKYILFHSLETLQRASYFDEENKEIRFFQSNDWFFDTLQCDEFDTAFDSKDDFILFIEQLQNKLI